MTTTGRIRVRANLRKDQRLDHADLQFAISGDIMEELFRLHDNLYRAYGFSPEPWHKRWKHHRMQFARFMDVNIPSVLIRIEAPTFEPYGARFRPYGKQYLVGVAARKLRVRPDLPTQNLSYIIDESLTGALVTFRDQDMAPIDTPTGRQRPIPRNENDMAVRSFENRR